MTLDQVHGALQRAIYNFPDISFVTAPPGSSREGTVWSDCKRPSKSKQAKRINNLVQKGVPTDSKEVRRMLSCRRVIVVEHGCQARKKQRMTCESPFCALCSVLWTHKRRRDAFAMFEGADTRYITLTVGAVEAHELASAIDDLTKKFAALRRRKAWKQHVLRGVAAIQIEPRAKNRFQPHLHVIVEGKFFPFPVLKGEWTDLVGKKSSVDLKQIKTTADLHRFARYTFRPDGRCPDPKRLSEDQVFYLRVALRRRKCVIWFGKKPNQPKKPQPRPCACCGDVTPWKWVESEIGLPPLMRHLIRYLGWTAPPSGPPENMDADPIDHPF